MRLLALLLAACCLATAGRAQRAAPDEKKIAELQKKVDAVGLKVKGQVAALREVYRTAERELTEAKKSDDGARLAAELARVLEPVLKEARTMGEKPTPANRAKVVAHLKKGVPEALAKTEAKSLIALNDYLAARVLAVLNPDGGVFEALALKDEELTKQALAEVLDDQRPFHLRWNEKLVDSVKAVESYRKVWSEFEDARTDLEVAKDPLLAFQIGAPDGFARLPAGSYVVEFSAGFFGKGTRKREKPHLQGREVYIGLNEVTVAEYYGWLQALPADEQKAHLPMDGGNPEKPLWPIDLATGKPVPATEILQHPVVGVRFPSALAYAKALGCRLPTEEEWAAVASGPQKLLYPWGETWEPNRCNDREAGIGGLRPVGSYPDGRGPFGHYDLSGNAAEWTMTYESGRTVDPAKVDDENVAVRGGSWNLPKKDVVVGWVWLKRARFERDPDTGFRLAMDKDAADGAGK